MLSVLLLFASSTVFAATKPVKKALNDISPSSVLFIGNSFFYYNNSMHSHFNALIQAGDKGYKMRSTSATISGSGLS